MYGNPTVRDVSFLFERYDLRYVRGTRVRIRRMDSHGPLVDSALIGRHVPLGHGTSLNRISGDPGPSEAGAPSRRNGSTSKADSGM
jgi:hypothetical protein